LQGYSWGWKIGAAESKGWQIGQQKWLLQIKKCEFCAQFQIIEIELKEI
jgi:hypothetical protein